MINRIKIQFIFVFLLLLMGNQSYAQLEKGKLVDGIAAVVGKEIILESDIEEQENYAKQQGTAVGNKCEFFESLLSQKFLIHQAKKDTLIVDRSKELKAQAEAKYQQILGQFPNEKAMLDAYKFRTGFEMKNMIEKIDSDHYYGQAKYARITEKTDVTPNEVTDFFNAYKYQLPEVKEEVQLAQIMIHPKLSDAHKQQIIDKLKKIKADILAGESFENMARIYSEDPGSASNGGLYKNVPKGRMVKVFEATALNLDEDEISDPVETEFGFHIIQLLRKSGKIYDARHILLKSEPNEQEIAEAKKQLQDIRQQILDGKISFKDAAYKYSDDKNTKFNAGVITSQEGVDKMEKLSLSPTISYQIAGHNRGDITDVFQDEVNQKKGLYIVKIENIIPAHQLDLATDFERIKMMALNKKKSEVVEKWVNERLSETFITIDNRYKDCKFKTNWSKEALHK